MNERPRPKAKNPHIGSSLDDFLREEGIYRETELQAKKEVSVWQLKEAMKGARLSRAALAKRLRTSRTQIDRLLDPACGVTLSSLRRAVNLVGGSLFAKHRARADFPTFDKLMRRKSGETPKPDDTIK